MGTSWGDRAWAAGAAVVVLLGTFTFAHRADLFFGGDEPHYAVYAQSLGRGWGLDLERAYRPENVARIDPFLPDAHAQRYRGEDSPFVTWHGIGLAALLAPTLGVSPTAWTARHTMVALAALLAYHLVLLVRRVARCSIRLAALAVPCILLAPPVLLYGALVFPEVPASLFVVLALRSGLAVDRRGRAVGASLAAGFLLLLNLRYGVLMAGVLGLLVVAEVRRTRPATPSGWWRATAPLLVPAGLIGVGVLIFDLVLYGRTTPPPFYASPGALEAPEYYRLDNLYFHGVGALLGFPDGIVPLAPVLLAPLVALPLAVRRIGAGAAVVLLASLVYVLGNAYFGSPLFGAPGRYVTTVIPLLAIPLAVLLHHATSVGRAVVGVLVVLTVISVATMSTDANQIFSRDRSGIEPANRTADLWPFIIEDRRPSSSDQSPEEILGLTGSLEDGARVARAPRDEAGTVAYGPYLHLEPGRYEVDFELSNPASRAAGLTLDVAAGANDRVVSEDVRLAGGARQVVSMAFSTDGTEDLELRVFWDGEGAVAVHGITADQVEELPGRDPEDEWWKAGWWTVAIVAVGLDLRRRHAAGLTA